MRRHYSDSYLQKIDWKKIQIFYDDGNFYNDIVKEFNISPNALNEAIKLGLIKMRDRSSSTKISKSKNPYKHTEETKQKISKIRKEYLKNNPDKVPYLLNHSRKESYPEKYFTEIFQKEKIDVLKKYRIGLYELDFAIPERKIDIEIDGEQHYCDSKIVESDKKRNEYLINQGWDIIRIRWSHYNKLSKNEKNKFIDNIKNYIQNISKVKPYIYIEYIYKNNRKKSLCSCGGIKEMKSKFCNTCRGINDRKVDRPSYEQLLEEISQLGYCGTGRKYGVSDNAIRKWIKKLNNV